MSNCSKFANVVLDRTGKLITIIGFATLCVILTILTITRNDAWVPHGVLVLSHFVSLLIGHVLRLEAPNAPPH